MSSLLDRKLNNDLWEWKTLEEIAVDIYSGSNEITGDIRNTGNQPAVKSGDISTMEGCIFYECTTRINPDLIKSKKKFKRGDILIISQSGSENVIGRT